MRLYQDGDTSKKPYQLQPGDHMHLELHDGMNPLLSFTVSKDCVCGSNITRFDSPHGDTKWLLDCVSVGADDAQAFMLLMADLLGFDQCVFGESLSATGIDGQYCTRYTLTLGRSGEA